MRLDGKGSEPAVAPHRFRGKNDKHPGHWTDLGAPQIWPSGTETTQASGEIRELLAEALLLLPEAQRSVVILRDVHRLTTHEICHILGITVTDARILLNQARAALRTALDDYHNGVA